MNQLFRKKPIQDLLMEASKDTGLKRELTAKNLILLGIGAIIGTGIFVLTGTAAANYAGPAIVLSFVISGIGCVFAGLCYAEFSSMIPIAGSAYTYSYATLGEFIAWIIGWDLILEYLFASSTVAVGWSGYFVSLLKDFNIVIPDQLSLAPFNHIPGQGWVATGSLINFPAVALVAIITTLLVLGIRESSRVNNIIVLIKVTVVLLFIAFGLSHINPANWTPFIPENTGKFGSFGISGIFTGAGVIFFAYIGFDALSTAAQETKNPAKDMPIGILVSLAVCTILYIAVAAILTGMVNYKELNVAAPIALAIDRAGNSLLWLRPWIKIGALAGLTSVVLVMLMGQPRIFFSMAKDGLLPKSFAHVHPRFGTPYKTTILTGFFAAIIAGLLPINILGELVSIGTLLAFVIVCTSVIVLRKTRPDVPRPFKTPWVPFVPIAGIVICLAQMVALPADTWWRLIIWMAMGLLIYFLYSRKRSKLAPK
ncbi:MAG TPA: amino acid permease [Prolixibacteraceae bacterium]|nr:amino acid permease [Prolixibacteraceae bacterium]